MWSNVVIALAGWLFVFVFATETCNPKACQRNGDNQKPVCGSDGLSYPTRCIFEKARCVNKNLTIEKRGHCKKQRSCSEWTTFNQQNPVYNITFTPKCRPDGTYDSAQCHLGANFCWCVTPEGVPLPYTSSRRKNDNKPPRCGRKKSTRRRSSMPNSRQRQQQRNRVCRRPDKSMLNNNLIDSFHTEFTRDSGRNDSDTFVITWKFQTLDQNSDHILDRFEYRDLRKVVRKDVKPRKCARHFPRSCDLNKDGKISLQEWDNCLTRGVRMDLNEGRSQNTSNGNDDDDDDSDNNDYAEDPFGPGKSTPHEVLSSALGSVSSFDEDSSEVAEDPTDCLSDRKTALAEGYQLYVPECTPDGRYQKIQCYKSAGYCWCVNEDTGKNIPGTSIKNGTPNCDHLKTNTRVMKGCPDDKKFIFLKELLAFLYTKMSEITNGTNTSSFNNLAWIASKEEQVATWSFVIFDKNKSKMLERNEWKAFKDMVGGVKGLRKCGKKLPRYCDINKDRQISMTEWLECLSLKQGVSSSSIPGFHASPRAGKTNPLSMLKDD
ncbi:SPARC-related modular calcium-binding protein 2 isoform X3 [Diabrotica virgifera virgifera]|uniref:SPARC-related modular calcium-binding protein 2 isoform X3 n=1 Tax=Diabrotica virgifera virgifera TaxID=50390 RepID=A0A6P7GV12_DIAVI|nr:SPARC-related modular calcium-binding protein 2 isoform X3 [Diabrotica virgifera virgifera]